MAVRLAKAGFKVTVFEKNDFTGGRCSLIHHKGYVCAVRIKNSIYSNVPHPLPPSPTPPQTPFLSLENLFLGGGGNLPAPSLRAPKKKKKKKKKRPNIDLFLFPPWSLSRDLTKVLPSSSYPTCFGRPFTTSTRPWKRKGWS